MAKSADSEADRSAVRKVVVTICLLAAAILFAGVARQSWSSATAAGDVVGLEADGAAMMHPMTTLLTQLVTAQSAAVRGDPVDEGSVRSALAALTQTNSEYGQELQTGQRLSDLTDQIQSAVGSGATGQQAYSVYSALVDLCVDMIHAIGDSSHLIHDPDLDSYYLMDAALVRLPDAMVYAGRAADLVALAGGSELAGEDLMRAAVARFNVSDDAERVSAGLTASVNNTARSQLGGTIAPRLDAFQAAADAFAPPTMLQELAADVDAATLADNASRVFAAAGQLSHQLLFELQALLQSRQDGVAQQTRFTAISTAAAAVLVIAMVWLILATRRRRPAQPAPTQPASTQPAAGQPAASPPAPPQPQPAAGARVGLASLSWEPGASRDTPAERGAATGRVALGGGDLTTPPARRSGHAR